MTPAPTGISARVTIDEALNRARNTINLPATVIMMAAWGQALILVPSGKAPLPVLMVSIFVGLSAWPVAWLYRAVMTPRWKLWAYGGAGNVQQMKAAAIAAKVISPDNSFAEKSEICSKGVRTQILKLEGRA